MAGKLQSKAPFPEAGKGAYFRFTLGALDELETTYGQDYYERVEAGLNKGSAKTILRCAEVGLFQPNETGRDVVTPLDPDEPIEWPLEKATEPILDALSLALFGKKYTELLEHIAKRQAEMAAELDKMDEEENPSQASPASSD